MSETMEKWELQELVDEAVATGQITEQMINEYVYEMKVGGRTIMDLTAASYHQAALEMGITTEDIKREDMTDGVMYTVTVARVDEKPSELWQRRIGVSYEPFLVSTFNKSTKKWEMMFDTFCYQKALTKATRNAIKQLVSATERFAVMKRLKEIPLSVGAKQNALPTSTESQTPPDMLPVPEADKQADAKEAVKERPDGESEGRTVSKRCFALWNKHQPLPKGSGKLPADFWERVKAKYGVQSRSTMTLVQWRDCLTFLSDTLNESEEAKKKEAEAKADEADVGIGDIGASDTDIEMHGQAKTDEAEAKAEAEMRDAAQRKFDAGIPAQNAALDAAMQKQKVEESRKVDGDDIPF